MDKFLYAYLALDLLASYVTGAFLPITAEIVNRAFLLFSLVRGSRFADRMKLRKKYGFTGWLYFEKPNTGLVSLDFVIFQKFHRKEFFEYIQKIKKEDIEERFVNPQEMDFLSDEAKTALSELYFASYGRHGFPFEII